MFAFVYCVLLLDCFIATVVWGEQGQAAVHLSTRHIALFTGCTAVLHTSHEEFTRLAETRLAQNSLNYL